MIYVCTIILLHITSIRIQTCKQYVHVITNITKDQLQTVASTCNAWPTTTYVVLLKIVITCLFNNHYIFTKVPQGIKNMYTGLAYVRTYDTLLSND